MKNSFKSLIAAVLLVGFASAVQAIPITGSVDMSGTVFLNDQTLGTATAATSFGSVTVGGIPTGAYTGTAGSSVTWSAFSWDATFVPVSPLWTFFNAGTGYTYTFALNSVGVVTQNNTFLNLLGAGTLSITGAGSPYTPTAGVWSFTISNPTGGDHANFAFTFANSQTAAGGVPDGGTTILLLGAALSGLGLIRRKLVA